MWKFIFTFYLVVLGLNMARAQVMGSGQVVIPSKNSLPLGEPQKLSEDSKGNSDSNATLEKFKNIQRSPETQIRNGLINRIQKSRIQMWDGGNVSGGGDESIPFTGTTEEEAILKDYQKNILGLSAVSTNLSEKKIKIAILDSGLSADSPVTSNVSQFIDFTSSCPQKTFCDDSSHGSLVADLISQAAPNYSLVILKTLSKASTGRFEHLLSALQWLVENHQSLNIRVVNLSLTSPEKMSGSWNEVDRARELVKKLDQEGVIVVSAVGNDFQNKVTLFPAGSPHVLAVGSFAHFFSQNPLDFQISLFSNAGYAENPKIEHSQFLGFQSTSRDFNSWVFKPDVLAPGENVLACLTSTSCQFVSGTSFAAALVTGGIANLLEKESSLTRKILIFRLKSSTCHQPFVMGDWDQSRACALKFNSL